ncbi:L-type lectin-domain containing receptor kinase IV.2-like [Iris pallida]|uniref:non-specific serine/threonine protein kinase n=1 Tax=Iris pallida TaxID=29817 RepID=A0AAX6HS62_IRIPA|nr:L-type lectin-domain containing receptor kinase IV.2-like [Iris pallida]
MASRLLKTLSILVILSFVSSREDGSFVFNGFRGTNLSLDGFASVAPDGLLVLTNRSLHEEGHAFHPKPFKFKSDTAPGTARSFSTTFVFAIIPKYSFIRGLGLVFVVSPTTDFSTALPNQYLGLFNFSDNGNATNHVLGIELDNSQNAEFQDINNNHVGIDVNSLQSANSTPAGYYDDSTGAFQNLTLASGVPMQIWVDYDGGDMRLSVTMAPVPTPKPSKPLLSSTIDLSSVVTDLMYVGFSSANGISLTTHCVLGWSFKMNGMAEPLDYAQLPPLPRLDSKHKLQKLAIWLPLVSCAFALLAVATVVWLVKRRNKYAELLEDWEQEYGPHRFSYKELFRATKGFKDKTLLGSGGFGRVYQGVLPSTNVEVAVKRVSHESRQGIKEFVAEIVSIGQLRHRNVVQLLGYCRRKGELLLVYDYMPNGSLDSFLYHETRPALSWAQRFRIIKGVAAGLLYLHQDWEQIVVHRDIKASNVLLDSELNGRLGDFGLARLYDHGTDAHTTHIMGTMGYLAPELAKTGKATTKTDVFAFGAFLLEVACGRRPVDPSAEGQQVLLLDWVLENWKRGTLLATGDPRLAGDIFPVGEMETVLKLGLLCSHPSPDARPTMRQVMHFLDGDSAMPDLPPAYTRIGILSLIQKDGFDDYTMSSSSSVSHMFELSGGR